MFISSFLISPLPRSFFSSDKLSTSPSSSLCMHTIPSSLDSKSRIQYIFSLDPKPPYPYWDCTKNQDCKGHDSQSNILDPSLMLKSSMSPTFRHDWYGAPDICLSSNNLRWNVMFYTCFAFVARVSRVVLAEFSELTFWQALAEEMNSIPTLEVPNVAPKSKTGPMGL